MPMERHRKPALPGADVFEALTGDEDPAVRAEAGVRVATVLVRGPHDTGDVELVERVVTLTDEHGLDAVADLWATAPAESIAGVLFRLYLIRAWVRANPVQAAREFEAGKGFTPVDEVIAGVADPPTPAEVIRLVDAVVGGVVTGEFSDILDRAASFAHAVGIGRAHLHDDPDQPRSAARLVETSRVLQSAARTERLGQLS
ncbi:MAG: hypothetical protein ACR2FL_04110 [Nocardioidaceae bacterium]